MGEFHFHQQDDPKFVTERDTKYLNMFSDPATHILYYKPSWDISLLNIMKGSGIMTQAYDKYTGTPKNFVELPSQSNPNPADTSWITEAIKTYPYPTGSMASVKQKLEKARQDASFGPISAELGMVGDPSYDICDKLAVRIHVPKGPNIGSLHPMSNLFIVVGITDDIVNGVFTTKLQLITGYGTTPEAANLNKQTQILSTNSDSKTVDGKTIATVSPETQREEARQAARTGSDPAVWQNKLVNTANPIKK
jgi:hypothetical protein